MQPDITTLRALLAIAERGSVTAASDDLDLSQQAISTRVRRLESDIGVLLLTRSPRGSTLTATGILVTQWARALVTASDDFDACVSTLRDDPSEPLRFSASLTIAEHLAPRWLVLLRADRRHKGLDTPLSMDAANSAAVIGAVRNRTAVVGFIETPSLPNDLASITVASDELVLVVGPGHPWAHRKVGITLTQLAATPLITREKGSGTRATFEQALGHVAMAPLAAELPTNAAIRSTVIAGSDPAVLSILAVSDDLKAGRLARVRIRDTRIVRPLSAIWLKGSHLPDMVTELLATARLGSGS